MNLLKNLIFKNNNIMKINVKIKRITNYCLELYIYDLCTIYVYVSMNIYT